MTTLSELENDISLVEVWLAGKEKEVPLYDEVATLGARLQFGTVQLCSNLYHELVDETFKKLPKLPLHEMEERLQHAISKLLKTDRWVARVCMLYTFFCNLRATLDQSLYEEDEHRHFCLNEMGFRKSSLFFWWAAGPSQRDRAEPVIDSGLLHLFGKEVIERRTHARDMRSRSDEIGRDVLHLGLQIECITRTVILLLPPRDDHLRTPQDQQTIEQIRNTLKSWHTQAEEEEDGSSKQSSQLPTLLELVLKVINWMKLGFPEQLEGDWDAHHVAQVLSRIVRDSKAPMSTPSSDMNEALEDKAKQLARRPSQLEVAHFQYQSHKPSRSPKHSSPRNRSDRHYSPARGGGSSIRHKLDPQPRRQVGLTMSIWDLFKKDRTK
ncbi:hypothetical protein T439DRAFT_360768 [Meredithblackwellia eburnea MCA 4105]